MKYNHSRNIQGIRKTEIEYNEREHLQNIQGIHGANGTEVILRALFIRGSAEGRKRLGTEITGGTYNRLIHS